VYLRIRVSGQRNHSLRISLTSPIQDYYGSQVQLSLGLASSATLFEGIINYEVAQSKCAIYLKAPWALPAPVGGLEVSGLEVSDTDDGELPGEPTATELVYYDQDLVDGKVSDGFL
jgi:hypothetical protein